MLVLSLLEEGDPILLILCIPYRYTSMDFQQIHFGRMTKGFIFFHIYDIMWPEPIEYN